MLRLIEKYRKIFQMFIRILKICNVLIIRALDSRLQICDYKMVKIGNKPLPLSEERIVSLQSLRSPSLENLCWEVGLFNRESLSDMTSSSSDGTMSESLASVCILKSKEFCREKCVKSALLTLSLGLSWSRYSPIAVRCIIFHPSPDIFHPKIISFIPWKHDVFLNVLLVIEVARCRQRVAEDSAPPNEVINDKQAISISV